MDNITLSEEVSNQINTKELLHVVNYFMESSHYFKGFDNICIRKMSSSDDENFGTMVTQNFEVQLFYAPKKNVKVNLKVYRAKSWSCSNTNHKVNYN